MKAGESFSAVLSRVSVPAAVAEWWQATNYVPSGQVTRRVRAFEGLDRGSSWSEPPGRRARCVPHTPGDRGARTAPRATTVGYSPFFATWSRDGSQRTHGIRGACNPRGHADLMAAPPGTRPRIRGFGDRPGGRPRPRPPADLAGSRFGIARGGSTITTWRFRAPPGPRAELQAHRLLGHDRWLVFPARCKRTPGIGEGLPCPVGHVRCRVGQACGT